MKYENEKQLKLKYAEVLELVGQANQQGEDNHPADQDVALIMLTQAVDGDRKLAGVPEGFDWNGLKESLL